MAELNEMKDFIVNNLHFHVGISDIIYDVITQSTISDAAIKKVNVEKYTHAQVGCECAGTIQYKGLSQIEKRTTLEEAYYTQFGAPYQPRGQYGATGPGFYQRNNGNSSYPDRRPNLEESLTKFMVKSAKRHEENSNIIKEIRASTDVAIKNQGASIKTWKYQWDDRRSCKNEGLGKPFHYTKTNLECRVGKASKPSFLQDLAHLSNLYFQGGYTKVVVHYASLEVVPFSPLWTTSCYSDVPAQFTSNLSSVYFLIYFLDFSSEIVELAVG
ncbi:hypothetical protein Tco_0116963 [Tanacetum coccineum]